MLQKYQVLKYIQENGSITSMEAFEKLGITRLSGRIFDLRSMGYKIVKDMVEGTTRTGNPCRYAKYFLVEVPN